MKFELLALNLAIVCTGSTSGAIEQHEPSINKRLLRKLDDTAQSMPDSTAQQNWGLHGSGGGCPIACGANTFLSLDGKSCELNPCLSSLVSSAKSYHIDDDGTTYTFVFIKEESDSGDKKEVTIPNFDKCHACSLDGLAVGGGGGGGKLGGGGGSGGAYEWHVGDLSDVDKLEIQIGGGGAGGETVDAIQDGADGVGSFITLLDGTTNVLRIIGQGGGGGARGSDGGDGLDVTGAFEVGQGGGGGGAGRSGINKAGNGGRGAKNNPIAAPVNGIIGGANKISANAGGGGAGSGGRGANVSGTTGANGGRGIAPPLASFAKDAGLIKKLDGSPTDFVAAGGAGAGTAGGGTGGSEIGGTGGGPDPYRDNGSGNCANEACNCSDGAANTGSGGGAGVASVPSGADEGACNGANGLVVVQIKLCDRHY